MRISDWSSDVCSSDLRSGQRIQILPGGGKQTPRRIVAEPALHRHIAAAVVRALHVEKRPAPGGLHHIPAIGRGREIVDDDNGGSALAGRLRELVGPTGEIFHRPAPEIHPHQPLLPDSTDEHTYRTLSLIPISSAFSSCTQKYMTQTSIQYQ